MQITISKTRINNLIKFWRGKITLPALLVISALSWYIYYANGLGLAYNDARSHLDIGRRVVEGLTPGFAQIGSVWLPLTHILMIPTVWNDFMWHSGLSGALQSMISFIAVAMLIYLFLKELGAGMTARYLGVLLFIANINVLYLQSTAMTELLLLATMTAGSYFLLLWAKRNQLVDLLKSAFFIMVSTLTRYDGWFLFAWAGMLIVLITWFRNRPHPVSSSSQEKDNPSPLRRRERSEVNDHTSTLPHPQASVFQLIQGTTLLYATLAAFGIALWFLWNWLIFGDPLYFAFGPFSAHTQQDQLLAAGNLPTKWNLLLSTKIYLYALFYNSYTIPAIFALIGAVLFWYKSRVNLTIRIASLALFAPLFFNILALYLGHSVLFIQGISGNTWFNVRYGVMLAPTIAIFAAYLFDKVRGLRWVTVGLLAFVLFFAFANRDAVTIDDATVGSSQKNVTEVSGWLAQNASDKTGYVLISVASHDAIIFSSGLPMKRFIHEGTGEYWKSATQNPDLWARWIVLRTHDDNDLTFHLIKDTSGFQECYNLVDHYPFADIYELKPEYLSALRSDL